MNIISELYTIISNKLWDLSLSFGDLHNRWVLASQQKALGHCKCGRFRAMQTYRNYIFSYLLTFVSVSESFYFWNMSHRIETLLTRPPIDCFLSKEAWARCFKRGLDHRLLTWCLWTATVAKERIEACCLITRLSRLRILQELMFSHKRYKWNITSMSFLLSFSWDLCCGTFLINASVSHLPSLFLVYNGIVTGEQYSKLWQ